MKVLKFGGTSAGTVESIFNLKHIVEQQEAPVIVVVSALGGVTDQLIATSNLAVAGNEAYKASFESIRQRHYDMIDAVIDDNDKHKNLMLLTENLLNELKSIYYGVSLVHDLSPRILSVIVSYGERLSSNIVASLIDGAFLYDARDFIKTEHRQGKDTLCTEITNSLVRKTLLDNVERPLPGIHVVPGFISSDSQTGETTNLGRGGSDYTASIIASAIEADVLEIWTDVDGFMTADPHVIPSAYTITELSYGEAMELCNFGAKVIYPPTIYPVCIKNIPILVKNTFNPNAPGTIIKKGISDNEKPIKGISSIADTALITVAGLSMVGVIGINRRIFTVLADNGISVFMVSQASSENSTSIGVRKADATKAVEVLNEEFSKEISTGAMYPMEVETGLATIAIVGENMKHTPGIAGKLFGALGRSGISVIACAQGASETNISFVVESKYLRKSLNTLHDSFFLSEYKVLNLFICGIGTVGGKLIEQIHTQQKQLMQTRRLKLNIVGIANSNHSIFNRNGIDLGSYKEILLSDKSISDLSHLKDEIISMNIFNSVFVDCTASSEVARLYQDFLNHNISVVAANKIAASGAYEDYLLLKETALRKGVKYLFETNVGAGLPIICTINDLCNSGDKILKIEAVLSGTLNFIFNELSEDVPFSETVRRACKQGYSEPDPRIDLSGTDVVRKLVILAREAGYKVEQSDVKKHLFIPDEFFEGSLDSFWQRLPNLDSDFENRRRTLELEKRRWRFVARMEHGDTSVSLEAIKEHHPFYDLEGSNNIILLTTERYQEYPLLIQGYGAGAGVTAAGVFANIISIANV